MNQTIDFDEKVEIEDLNESNSIKINDMEEKEIQNLYEQVYKNIQEQTTKKLEDEKFSDLINLFTGNNQTRSHYDLDYDV